MEIGIVGLGRMGAGMARRLARGGARVVCYDQAEAAREALAGEPNVDCAENLAALCARLARRARDPADRCRRATRSRTRSATCCRCCSAGDTLVDGGNSYYRDSMRRALALSQQGLRYIDAGVSGGVHGLENGYCLMLGGTPKSIEIFEPFARTARARRRARLAALRPERRRPLRQDDPQRHRVRDDAVARRGLRAARRAARARHRRRRASPRPGATAAWCAPGCSICAPRS